MNKSRSSGELMLYGPIGGDYYGEGVTAKDFDKALKSLGNVKDITLRINSEGGSVTEARAIYNMLVKNSAKIHVEVEGIAASAATFVAMAGDRISIGESDLFMIHNASALVLNFYTGDGLKELSDTLGSLLKKIDSTIIDMYQARTGISRSKLQKWMNEETFFTGKEAFDNGFATDLIANRAQIAACITNEDMFKNFPGVLKPNRARAMFMLNRSTHA